SLGRALRARGGATLLVRIHVPGGTMIFSHSAYDERAARATSIAAELAAEGVRFMEMQFPDMNGMMRGKYTPLAKGLSASGSGLSCLLYSSRGGDQLTIDFWADFDNGFPKIVGLPDYDTVTRCPWRPDTAAVLCDFYMEDGTPCPMDARQILRNIVAEYHELGLQPRASVEFETYIYEVDDDLMRAKRYAELKSYGPAGISTASRSTRTTSRSRRS